MPWNAQWIILTAMKAISKFNQHKSWDELIKETTYPLASLDNEQRKLGERWINLAIAIAPLFNCEAEEVIFVEDANDEELAAFAMFFYARKAKENKSNRRKRK